MTVVELLAYWQWRYGLHQWSDLVGYPSLFDVMFLEG